jgi:hypothetical protein
MLSSRPDAPAVDDRDSQATVIVRLPSTPAAPTTVQGTSGAVAPAGETLFASRAPGPAQAADAPQSVAPATVDEPNVRVARGFPYELAGGIGAVVVMAVVALLFVLSSGGGEKGHGGASATVEPRILREDDFTTNSGAFAARATPVSNGPVTAVWNVVNGALTLNVTGLTPRVWVRTTEGPMIITKDPYAIDFDVSYQPAALPFAAGVSLDNLGTSSLAVYVSRTNFFFGKIEGTKTAEVIGQGDVPPLEAGKATPAPEAARHLRLEVDGTTATLFVNGAMAGSVTDEAFRARPARVKMFVSAVTGTPTDAMTVQFDNLKITAREQRP